jgi:transposase InsO family protein
MLAACNRSKTEPLDLLGQWDRRTAERRARMSAIAFGRWLGRQGQSRRQAAARLGLRAETLGRWARAWQQFGRLAPILLGRRRTLAKPELELDVRQHVEALGPTVGLPALKALFPKVARSQLRQIQQRFRSKWQQDHPLTVEELQWHVPGAVWATDFTDPPVPIDGRFRHVLVVRDLASQFQLLALPVEHADAATAAAALELLFRAWTPPLVLKSDNGGAFTGLPVSQLLISFLITSLLSPPCTPRYNGAIEAGSGTLKTRAFYEAANHGRSAQWSSDDLEAASCRANELSRPWGVRGPTPAEAWLARRPLGPLERQTFVDAVRRLDYKVRFDEGLENELLNRAATATVARAAIRRALEELGYLSVQRRRITPPFNSHFRGKIS